ncbi:hypothetical protein ABBQ32_010511 [Trebouxia sp. C0010 RCD-2024]
MQCHRECGVVLLQQNGFAQQQAGDMHLTMLHRAHTHSVAFPSTNKCCARSSCSAIKQGVVRAPRAFGSCRTRQYARKPTAHEAAAVKDVPAASHAEEEANQKRWKESGGGVGPVDQWRWSLNWDQINSDIVVGSCPRSASDVDRMVDEAGISAIICLQSEACFEAMQIDWPIIRQQAIHRGVTMTRVAVRDFDHNDQALMLPEAVRLLHLLVANGKRVYVHCTAGINRATLTVVGYLTFVKGMTLDSALHEVKTARPQAHPYVDCWKRVRARLIADRKEEVEGVAKMIYNEKQARGQEGHTDGFADWVEAENRVIRSTFERQTGCSLSLTSSMQVSLSSCLLLPSTYTVIMGTPLIWNYSYIA